MPIVTKPCKYCGRPLSFVPRSDRHPDPQMHNICYNESRKFTPSAAGYMVLEYLEGQPDLIKESEMIADLPVSRSAVQKALYKLRDLNMVKQYQKGWRIMVKGIKELNKKRFNSDD